MGEAWVVVDLGFGDAGKGSIVDFLVRDRDAELVVRFNGGAQAGHTVVTEDGRHHTFAQFGAGSFVDGVRTHLGPRFVLHPGGMLVEAQRLEELGVGDVLARTTVDEHALLISPFHQAAGRLRELLRGNDSHGTCGVGVGEAVADSLAGLDDTLRAADLGSPDVLRKRLASQQRRKRLELLAAKRLIEPRAFVELSLLADPEVVDRTVELWGLLAREIDVVDYRGASRILDADRVVFEGAQGVLLDETWGFHPHTTWSDCTFGPALQMLAGRECTRLGVLRTYMVRHGKGPFPTHEPQFDQVLLEPHNHGLGWQGAVRKGPLDLVLLRYAARVCGGLDGLALTHMDQLQGGAVPVCGAYELDDRVAGVQRDEHGQVIELEPGSAGDLSQREQLGTLLGWSEGLYFGVPMEQLPEVLRAELGVPVLLQSAGPTAADKEWCNR